MNDGASMNSVISWLEKKRAQVFDIENKAIKMMKEGNIEGYRENMKEKARVLAHLSEEAQPHLAGLSDKAKNEIGKTLKGYSNNAAMALQLDSVFFMSALLYPDEHKPGEPDNFRKFIDTLGAF